jgi:hypothetical protein
MRVFLLLALCALPPVATAQYAGPALETCRAFGERSLKAEGTLLKSLAIDHDRHLHFERRARKLGSQAVGASLSGHGAIVLEAGAPVEVSFQCLLASEKRALWFHWLPRRDAPSLAQCRRVPDTGQCLQVLFDIAERDHIEISSIRFQQAQDAGAGDAFRATAAAWREYRDLECARRGTGGSDEWRACMVDFTRQRYLALQ